MQRHAISRVSTPLSTVYQSLRNVTIEIYLLNFLHALPGVQEEGYDSGVELRKVRLGDEKCKWRTGSKLSGEAGQYWAAEVPLRMTEYNIRLSLVSAACLHYPVAVFHAVQFCANQNVTKALHLLMSIVEGELSWAHIVLSLHFNPCSP